MAAPIWNITMTIVELVAADSADEAISRLYRRLDMAGLTPYEGSKPDAFESEPLDPDVEKNVRSTWARH